MKKIILLSYFSLFAISVFADNSIKEKKLLIETIKSNYDSWQVKHPTGHGEDTSDIWPSGTLRSSSSKKIEDASTAREHIFSDFRFKICENQAIVRFQVDFQEISAFMEKKDGKWSLVCAAVIPPEI